MAATPIKIEVQNSGPSLKNTIYIFRHTGENVHRGLPQGFGDIPATARIGRAEPAWRATSGAGAILTPTDNRQGFRRPPAALGILRSLF